MHHRRNRLYRALLCILTILVICVCLLLDSKIVFTEERNTLQFFEINPNALPDTISYTDGGSRKTNSVVWKIDNLTGLNIFPKPIHFSSKPEQSTKGWFISGKGNNYYTKIYVDLIKYPDSFQPDFFYWYLEPRRFYSSSVCWNPNYQYENYIPKNWKAKNKIAQKENVYCCNGNELFCDSWNYQEKIDQYYLNIHFGGYESDISSFTAIIDAINNQLFLKNKYLINR